MSRLGDILPFCGPGTSHALPLSHSPPPNLLYLLKRKTCLSFFQPVKPLERSAPAHEPSNTGQRLTPWTPRGFFAPKINNMEVIFL